MPKDTHIIEVKTKGAAKSQKQIKGVGNALGGMAKKAGVAAAAYFGSQALLQGIQSSIDLFAKQEIAEKKLRFAAGASTEELIKQAKSLQQVTSFGDEAIIAQQAYVKSLGVSTEQTKEIIAASVDLASAMNISLESAVMNTTKTLSGMQGELGEKLPAAFKLLTAEQLKAGEGIKFIREQFKGTAEVDAKSLTGQLEQMRNAVGDAGEAMGELLSPVVSNLAGIFKTAAENVAIFFKRARETELETTIREMQELGVAGDALARLKNLQLDKEIEALNKELEKSNNNNMTSAQIEEQLKEIADERLRLGVQISEKAAEDFEEKERLFHEEMNFARDRFAREKQLMEDSNATREDFAAQERREKEELAEIARVFREETAQNEQARLEQLQAEEEQLVTNAARLEQINALENQRVEIKDKETKKDDAEDKKTEEKDKKKSKIKDKLAKLELENKGKIKEKIKELDVFEKGKDIKEGLRTAYGIGADAYRYGTKLGGPVLGAILGAVGLAGGLAYQKKIMAAQYGADFVTSGPQLMMVGEGSGPERVQVTPLVDENINGPQGGGITLNISGNVMSEEYTEEVIIPQIKEGLRLGGDIGI